MRRRVFESELSASEAARVLAENVEPRRWLRLGARSRTFQGTVGADSFEIERIIGYRNSFLPRIRGTIHAGVTGSVISVSMHLAGSVLLFLVVWVVGVGGIAFASMTHGAPPVALALLVLFWLMTIGGFSFEAARAERILRRLLRAKPG